MQVEDERRHADQYKEQVPPRESLFFFTPGGFIHLPTHNLSLPVRWKKPTRA